MLGVLEGHLVFRQQSLLLIVVLGVLGGSHRGLMELLGEILHLRNRGLVLLRGAVSRTGNGPRSLRDGEGRDIFHGGGCHHDHA